MFINVNFEGRLSQIQLMIPAKEALWIATNLTKASDYASRSGGIIIPAGVGMG